MESKQVRQGVLRYGALISWARQLGRGDCASVPDETSKQKKRLVSALTLGVVRQRNQGTGSELPSNRYSIWMTFNMDEEPLLAKPQHPRRTSSLPQYPADVVLSSNLIGLNVLTPSTRPLRKKSGHQRSRDRKGLAPEFKYEGRWKEEESNGQS
jgi:hypothetical protein